MFNFILLDILILCFCAIIPQPVADTFFLIIIIITRGISQRANSGNKTNHKILFTYVLLFADVSGTSRVTKISRISTGHERRGHNKYRGYRRQRNKYRGYRLQRNKYRGYCRQHNKYRGYRLQRNKYRVYRLQRNKYRAIDLGSNNRGTKKQSLAKEKRKLQKKSSRRKQSKKWR